MTNIRLLVAKEFRAAFNGPTAYILLVVFLLMTGWFFASPLFIVKQASLNELVGVLPILFVFLIPAITMRAIAEELKSGTIELLATLPLKDYEIVLGKYLAILALLGIALGLTGGYPLVLGFLGKLDRGHVLGVYLGMGLLGGAFSAMGLFASSLTKNQMVAFIIGFALCFAFFLFGKMGQWSPPGIRALLDFLGIDRHLEAFVKGVLDTRDLLYFVSVATAFLSAAIAVVSSRRWR
ncbi:MAG: ABC transporter permease [Elusimicrobia bacterium]|nr:ABC transporter permease [Elusimicrobiota bacterium]